MFVFQIIIRRRDADEPLELSARLSYFQPSEKPAQTGRSSKISLDINFAPKKSRYSIVSNFELIKSPKVNWSNSDMALVWNNITSNLYINLKIKLNANFAFGPVLALGLQAPAPVILRKEPVFIPFLEMIQHFKLNKNPLLE